MVCSTFTYIFSKNVTYSLKMLFVPLPYFACFQLNFSVMFDSHESRFKLPLGMHILYFLMDGMM